MNLYIKGNYIKSIFESNNGYIIGLFKVIETNDQDMEDYIGDNITFTGYFADLNINDTYTFYGELIDHPKYGLQYQVNSFSKIKPKDKDGIIVFLSSDLFNGIGVKLATKIVEELGENTLDLILENKENLKKIKMSEKKLNTIYDTLLKYESSSKIVVYLNEIGFSMRESLLIYNKYKEDTELIIDNNIYKLLDDKIDISFTKIDNVYLKLEKDVKYKNRIEACIIHIMNNLVFKNSDTYLYYDEIKKETLSYLKYNIEDEEFILYLDELRFLNKIVLENDRYYLKELLKDEEEIVRKIVKLNKLEETKIKNIDSYIEELESYNNIEYSNKQKEAIKYALEKNIVIVTGGPGTGKTTLIKAIVELYKNINELENNEAINKIALLAPTGRASKRMSESTNFPSSTIHRYLKWDKESNSFCVDEFNKNKEKLIIIDEVSMIDTNLLASLFRGTLDDIKLVLVGDYNQLPSVGPGQVLKDLILSEYIDVVELDLLYRQENNSYISNLANEIKENSVIELKQKTSDFLFLECSQNKIKESIINIAKQFKEKKYDYKTYQFLAPQYAGINGIDSLNKELQIVFNPSDNEKIEVKYGDVIFRENDKILQLVNMTDNNVFNGDVGIIKYIIPFFESDSGKNEIYIDFDGNIVKYLPSDFSKIKHGYIISIHKSQGSEFNTVVIPICKSYKRMLYKKLIYTGITRAKNKLILLGEIDSFNYSINNDVEILRKTSLLEKIKKVYEK